MMGTSYVGGTQHAAALRRPGGLVTVIPVDAVSNPGRQGMRNAGRVRAAVLELDHAQHRQGEQGVEGSRDPEAAPGDGGQPARKYLMNLPLRRGRRRSSWRRRTRSGSSRRCDHGGERRLLELQQQHHRLPGPLQGHARLPRGRLVRLVGGNTTANFTALTKALTEPGLPDHGPVDPRPAGQARRTDRSSFGPDAAIADPARVAARVVRPLAQGRRQQGRQGGAVRVEGPPVHDGVGRRPRDARGLLYHGGSWRDETEWPPAKSKPTPYYFQRDRRTDARPGRTSTEQHELRLRSEESRCRRSAATSRRATGSCCRAAGTSGAARMSGTSWIPCPLRAGTTSSSSAPSPLADDVEVTGEIQVKLWASSTAPDTDFTAKLIDVYPPSADFPGGFDLNITEGHHPRAVPGLLSEETLMEPGNVYTFTIKLYPTSNIFRRATGSGWTSRAAASAVRHQPEHGGTLNGNRRWATRNEHPFHDQHHLPISCCPSCPSKNRAVRQEAGREARRRPLRDCRRRWRAPHPATGRWALADENGREAPATNLVLVACRAGAPLEADQHEGLRSDLCLNPEYCVLV